MPNPVELLPWRLAIQGTTPATTATAYMDFSKGYDFAIAGIPFISASDKDNPFMRKSIQIQKPRQDFEEEPGEQTFQAWWTRAQSSFHAGAGLKYRDVRQSSLESDTSVFEHYRFQASAGVNVWTPGQVSLLHAAPVVKTGTTPLVISGNDGTNNCLLIADGSAITKVTETVAPDGNGVPQPTYSSPTSVSWTGATTVLSLCTDGVNYYAVGTDGVYKGALATPAVAAVKIYTFTGGTSAVVAWVKQRLALALTQNTPVSAVYELDANAAASTALPTAAYAHPNKAWVWTAIEDGPQAVYIAGFSNTESAVYSLTLQSSGVFPVLTAGTTAIEMPQGESVTGLQSAMGTVIGVSTTRGFRLGIFGAGGTIGLGPLIIIGTTYGALTTRDRYIYVGYQDSAGVAGLARVDCGMPLSHQLYTYSPEQIYAWAPDVRAEDNTLSGTYLGGAVTSACVIADRVAFAVTGQGTFVEHPSALVKAGTLLTSRERMNTLELKLPRFIRLRSEVSWGTIAAQIGVETDVAGATLATLTPALKQDSGDVLLTAPPASWVTLTFTLGRQSDSRKDEGPVFTGFQLKVLPVVNKQRNIRLPVYMYGNELSRTGENLGRNPFGSVMSRLLTLEAHENSGDVVTFQALMRNPGDAYSVLVTIDDIEFQEIVGPMERSGWGGRAVITLRTVQ